VYDELPYRSLSIEWTAPERLALASALHGGPRARLDNYRVLEIGCADGSNLIPMAWYRPQGTFIGIDAAQSQIAVAHQDKKLLGLDNVDFVAADLRVADRHVAGDFDFIIAHGVFSWIPDATRDAMLAFCARRLRRDGLLYLNYNAHPGWQVRGLVRKLLLAGTDQASGLRERALLAQDIATQLAVSMSGGTHAFTQLLVSELQFVTEHDPSYVAHEYLAPDNCAYWRSEFLQLVGGFGLEYVADADFNYPSGRVTSNALPPCLQQTLSGLAADDASDLLFYRQLHSPVLCLSPLARHPHSLEEFSGLWIASVLSASSSEGEGSKIFRHPSGYEVEAKESGMQAALTQLRAQWPQGMRIAEVFPDVASVMDDLKLLHQNGLIELRCREPDQHGRPAEILNRMQAQRGSCITTAYHTREAVPADWA
jgi:SAM-dependent methyltransferase